VYLPVQTRSTSSKISSLRVRQSLLQHLNKILP
jgi:hypothetical protein